MASRRYKDQVRPQHTQPMTEKRAIDDSSELPINKKALKTFTAKEQEWLNELRVKQSELLKEPAFPDRQKQALSAMAVARFGVDVTFVEGFQSLTKGVVFPVILKYTNGYTPPNPSRKDVGISLGGGYAQKHVSLALAMVVKEAVDCKIEVEFDTPKFMSYRNGVTVPRSNFLLCEDGTVQYSQNDEWKEWTSFVPKWKFAAFPLVKVVCTGFDL